MIVDSDNPYAPVAYLKLKKLSLMERGQYKSETVLKRGPKRSVSCSVVSTEESNDSYLTSLNLDNLSLMVEWNLFVVNCTET